MEKFDLYFVQLKGSPDKLTIGMYINDNKKEIILRSITEIDKYLSYDLSQTFEGNIKWDDLVRAYINIFNRGETLEEEIPISRDIIGMPGSLETRLQIKEEPLTDFEKLVKDFIKMRDKKFKGKKAETST